MALLQCKKVNEISNSISWSGVKSNRKCYLMHFILWSSDTLDLFLYQLIFYTLSFHSMNRIQNSSSSSFTISQQLNSFSSNVTQILKLTSCYCITHTHTFSQNKISQIILLFLPWTFSSSRLAKNNIQSSYKKTFFPTKLMTCMW